MKIGICNEDQFFQMSNDHRMLEQLRYFGEGELVPAHHRFFESFP